MIRLTPAAALVPGRWKNGGGATTELAAFPLGAPLDAFEWRLSMAAVETDGPFSRFPGVDRTLLLVAGAGMQLTIAGAAITLADSFAQTRFSGDDPVDATLLSGPVRDCNLMVRRPLRGTLRVVQGEQARLPAAAWRVCHVLAGQPRVQVDDSHHALQPHDTLCVDAAHASAALVVDATSPGATVIVATVTAPA